MSIFCTILPLCVAAASLCAQGNPPTAVPDSVLHVNKTDQDKIEFRVGGSTVFAIGLADINGKIRWADFCERQFQPGQTATVPNAGRVVSAITTSGVYGDKTAVDDLYRRYVAEQTVWHRWQDLARSYSTDSKTFVEQITGALADVAVPPAPDATTTEESSGTWIALKLLKGNVQNISAQTEEEPRKVTLLYLAHEVGTFDACVTAARSGRVQ